MDFEAKINALESEGIHLLFAGICHDKRRPKYWVQLQWHPHGAYAYGNTLSEALAATELALRVEHTTAKQSTITLEDLGLA